MRRLRLGVAVVGLCVSAEAQWLNQPMAGAPRTPDGKVNMTRPVSRVNGKPFKSDERPLTPAGAEVRRQHGLPGAFNLTLNCLPDGIPHGDLLPEPFKILHSPGVIVMLDE